MMFANDFAKCNFSISVQKCSATKAKFCTFFRKNCAKVLRMETLIEYNNYHKNLHFFITDLHFNYKNFKGPGSINSETKFNQIPLVKPIVLCSGPS